MHFTGRIRSGAGLVRGCRTATALSWTLALLIPWTLIFVPLSAQTASVAISARDLSGVQMVGPSTALVWAESAQEFRMWRVQFGGTPQWTEIAIPLELAAFKRVPQNPDEEPYIAVNAEAGMVRLLWLQRTDCEDKGWERLQQAEEQGKLQEEEKLGAIPCQFTLYQAEGETARLLAHPEKLGAWTVTRSLLTDTPEAILESVKQIKMLDRRHGWMVLQGASEMNSMPEAVVTTSDGRHWSRQASMPIGDDYPQLLLPRSADEAWFAAAQPIGIWHTVDGGKVWTSDAALQGKLKRCEDCDTGSVWGSPPQGGRPCLEFSLDQSNNDPATHTQQQDGESIDRFCVAPDGQTWTGPTQMPVAGGGDRSHSASATVFAGTQLGFSAVTANPAYTSTIFETTDGGTTWHDAALGAAGTDAWVEQVSTNGKGVLVLLSDWKDGNKNLMFSPDSGANWIGVAPPARLAEARAVSVVSEQNVSMSPDPGAKLVFGDGDLPRLLAIGNRRAITYMPGAAIIEMPSARDFSRLFVAEVVKFDPDTTVLSVSADGRKAIIATGSSLFILNTITGQRQDIPLSWYRSGENPDAALSGNGRLVSIFSEFPMTVTVFDWPTKTLIAKRTSENISAGGIDGGGVTVDGAVEFVNNRVGRKVVNLKTGDLIGWFGPDSVRSPNGDWVVDMPDMSFKPDSAPREVLIKDGNSGQTRGKINVPVPDSIVFGQMTGAFCGTTGRFVLASGRGVAVYTIPSGALLASFPEASWRDASAGDTDPVSVACSPSGTRVAILSGTRLTIHDLR